MSNNGNKYFHMRALSTLKHTLSRTSFFNLRLHYVPLCTSYLLSQKLWIYKWDLRFPTTYACSNYLLGKSTSIDAIRRELFTSLDGTGGNNSQIGLVKTLCGISPNKVVKV